MSEQSTNGSEKPLPSESNAETSVTGKALVEPNTALPEDYVAPGPKHGQQSKSPELVSTPAPPDSKHEQPSTLQGCNLESTPDLDEARAAEKVPAERNLGGLKNRLISFFAWVLVFALGFLFFDWKDNRNREIMLPEVYSKASINAFNIVIDDLLSDLAADHGEVRKGVGIGINLDEVETETTVRANCRFVSFRDVPAELDALLYHIPDENTKADFITWASILREHGGSDVSTEAFLTVADGKGNVLGRTRVGTETTGRSIEFVSDGGSYSASLSVEKGDGGFYILKFEDASPARRLASELIRQITRAEDEYRK